METLTFAAATLRLVQAMVARLDLPDEELRALDMALDDAWAETMELRLKLRGAANSDSQAE